VKYLFISHTVKQGFEFTDFRCYQNLKKYLKIKMVCLSRDNEFSSMPTYSSKIKSKITKDDKNIIWSKSEDDIKLNLIDHDAIIISSIQGSKIYSEFAKKIGKIVVLLDTYFNQDFYGNPIADLIIFKNSNSKKIFDKINKKKNKYNFKISGCIQTLNLKKNLILNKKEFYQKYNLNKNKLNCLFLPSGPQHHSNKFKEIYVKICGLLNKNNYNTIIKLHPTEYNIPKLKKFYKSGNTSNSILNNLNHKIIDPCDFYSAILNSKFILAINTNSFHEVNFLGKPIIYVERLQFYNIKFSKNYFLNKKKFQIYEYINKYIYKNLTKNNQYYTERNKSILKYFGCEVQISDLSTLLNKKKQKNKLQVSTKLKKEISPLIYNNKKSFYNLAKDIDNFCKKKNDQIKGINFKKDIVFFKVKALIKKILYIKS